MHPIFKIRERETPEILELLNSVILGTNGAHYRHLDTTERIKEADHPLFLSMERNGNVISNVTFCRRGQDWYIRYFAFSNKLQSVAKKRSKAGKNNLLKRELDAFFESALSGVNEYGKVNSFYAYIDPNNEKSLWLSESLGFETVGQIATQTFSRVKPKQSPRIEKLENWDPIEAIVRDRYKQHQYFFTDQTSKPPFYVMRDEEGQIIASVKTSISTWEIKRLPGKMGGVLTKMIPFIPGLNRIIKPKKHSFVVPEAVYVKNNDPQLLNELFEGVLAMEQKNLILWWVDINDPLYDQINSVMKWGVLHKLVGVNHANVVRRAISNSSNQTPFYTSGFDFI